MTELKDAKNVFNQFELLTAFYYFWILNHYGCSINPSIKKKDDRYLSMYIPVILPYFLTGAFQGRIYGT